MLDHQRPQEGIDTVGRSFGLVAADLDITVGCGTDRISLGADIGVLRVIELDANRGLLTGGFTLLDPREF